MKVLVLGASGIVGQTMRLRVPPGVEAVYARRVADPLHVGIDASHPDEFLDAIRDVSPSVVVNFAGESRVDVVERDPDAYHALNVSMPSALASLCSTMGAFFIHVSTQAVFSGLTAPYSADDIAVEPVNAYGRQKLEAERLVCVSPPVWCIARLTLVLGVRPLPHVGRENPLEAMLGATSVTRQVGDRWFSPCFAEDAADALWRIALAPDEFVGKTVHVGVPERWSRYDLAVAIRDNVSDPSVEVVKVSHNDFPGIAQRPIDTTYASGALHNTSVETGLGNAGVRYYNRLELDDLDDRATELALFLGIPEASAHARLAEGFAAHHARVAEDWRAANPQTDEEILAWYRATESYLWELTAYHLDTGFNYAGMCEGIGDRLRAEKCLDVLCLGDGIGDLTFALLGRGIAPTYHDVGGSVTARFFAFRHWRRFGPNPGALDVLLSTEIEPPLSDVDYDAVVALDFFEHVPNVDQWTRAAFGYLRSGGLLLAQNAFGIGDAAHGDSIPMHLSRNNVYAEPDASAEGMAGWDVLLTRVGFVRDTGGWWRKPSYA